MFSEHLKAIYTMKGDVPAQLVFVKNNSVFGTITTEAVTIRLNVGTYFVSPTCSPTYLLFLSLFLHHFHSLVLYNLLLFVVGIKLFITISDVR